MGRAARVAAALAVGGVLAACAPPNPGTGPGPGPSSGWPTASSTGVTDESVLTEWTGDCTFRTPGQVVENKVFDCGPDIYAPGVTIRNSIIRGNEWWGINLRAETGDPAIIENVTFDPGTCNPGGVALGAGNYHATAVKVVNFGDAFRYSGDNTVVRDSYAKLCAPADSGAHSDGMQGYLAGDATAERPNRFEHNTIDQRCADWGYEDGAHGGGTGDPADNACSVTANVFWADESGNGLVVTGNLFRGGGYTIRVHSGTGHTVRDNVVERDSYAYGPVSSSCSAIDWSGNQLADILEDGTITNAEPLPCTG